MRLRPPRHRAPLLLSYEMNVHRGETLAQTIQALEDYTLPVRERVAPGQPFGLAPRIGRGLLADLKKREHLEELRAMLAARDLFVFTVNAFPLEDFHQKRVKDEVYSPPWTTVERARLTCGIADVLAELLPPGLTGTISTLGGTYRYWPGKRTDPEKIARNYLAVVSHLARLERERGITILLTAEPEPDTTFEVADDVVRLKDDHMLPLLGEVLAKPLGVTRVRAEELFYRFFDVNLDVCHQSVLFRNPVAEWRTLERAGLRVGKLHITNALALPRPARSPAALAELRRYDEPRYLHQFAGRRTDGSLHRGRDLGELRDEDLSDIEEVRVHFHVPLSRARMGPLSTTRAETSAALEHALGHADPPHLVIETYTWPLLAEAGELVSGIAREFRWVLELVRTRSAVS